MTVDDVFKEFGGRPAMVGILGVTSQAIWNMVDRGTIPSKYWQTLVDEAKAREIEGITFEALAAIQSAKAPIPVLDIPQSEEPQTPKGRAA